MRESNKGKKRCLHLGQLEKCAEHAGATANAPNARVDDITKRVGASARETEAKYQHASRVT